ncbi:hypothetical protein Save01_08471 [Streptomyces avermitilis]|uniref:Uncharacterized protein n=2 Tax=Streptomyces avermitilis TaxID=33903 RepID=A0A143SZR1_STRAW|nr:hypothetical protein SAVERM_2p167 [Streptomyces avermitilis MA-4680 = NBRC 14893]GDY70278.1 hypothetical protein SAV14893_096710 [Streptomyces avermitilis]GDY80586.1 hypothetical protein SAV31267_100710 [Streptomyces avermitilis]
MGEYRLATSHSGEALEESVRFTRAVPSALATYLSKSQKARRTRQGDPRCRVLAIASEEFRVLLTPPACGGLQLQELLFRLWSDS